MAAATLYTPGEEWICKTMADLPPPPPAKEDPADFAVVTMVHKVKSRLGYTEMITPTPVNQLGGDNQVTSAALFATVMQSI